MYIRPHISLLLALGMIISLLISCNSPAKKVKEQDIPEAIKGNWLILYPDHQLKNSRQRELYGLAQDSIVGLLGLKTISFLEEQIFYQTDSLFRSAGQWSYRQEDRRLTTSNGGRGLDPFEGNLLDIVNDTMRVAQDIMLGTEKIRLVWHLKKISDKKMAPLFGPGNNWWRKQPPPEKAAQLKTRIKAMLNYYALYYEMVANESIYFSYSRVFLPFKYYQHAVGLRPFNEKDRFSRFFYSAKEAQQAYLIIEEAMDKLKLSDQKYPSGKNFVIEYSMFLSQLAGAMDN